MDKKKVKIGFLLLIAILLSVAALLVFGWLAEEVFEGEAQQFDSYVRTAVHQLATPELTRLMRVFSFLGSVAAIASLALLAVCLCLYFHRTRIAALLTITVLGAAALDETLKHAFHRPRPVPFFGEAPNSYSFPSGHALSSLCFYGILGAILAARVRGRTAQIGIWLATVMVIGLIGFSRIYLGVHYPSDVIAGYCAGAMWVAAIGFLDKTIMKRPREELSPGKSIQADESIG